MPHELIITSVRKGLDGGSGYQPVLRTQGMKQAIAERLQIRCGYSHPYSHGNTRNPIVYVHRIERISGETIHILARIADAGSDHTGRSNFLAHLLALQDGEARRYAAGPAEAIQCYSFKDAWNEQPREQSPPSLKPSDRTPRVCESWRKAGLDPGIAGDLAEAAITGSAVCLITREADDVLELFAEALTLVPPAKRWQVTFNTCEIEPFDAVWRAVREDLPQARLLRGEAGAVDLTRPGLRGSDRPYARFARGEVGSLPWQTAAVSAADNIGHEASPSHASAPPARTHAHLAPPVPAKQKQGVPPAAHVRGSIGPISQSSNRSKRNLLDSLDLVGPDTPAVESRKQRRSLVPVLVVMAAVLCVIAIVSVAYVALNPATLRSVAAHFQQLEDLTDAKRISDDQAATDKAHEEAAAAAERERLATEREQKADEERLANEKAKLDQQQREREELKQAETNGQRAKEAKEAAARERQARQDSAFTELKHLPTSIPTNLPSPNTSVGFSSATNCEPIILGKLTVADLVDFSLGLALPVNEKGDKEFDAEIEKLQEPNTWQIKAPDKALDGRPIKQHLATVMASGTALVITPNGPAVAKSAFNSLRQCVLLVSARSPQDDGTHVITPIQLVVPEKAPAKGVLSFIDGMDQQRDISLKCRPWGSARVKGLIEFNYGPDWKKAPTEYPFDDPIRDSNDPLKHFYQTLFEFVPPKSPPSGYDTKEKTTLGVSVVLKSEAGVQISPEMRGAAFNRDYHMQLVKMLLSANIDKIKNVETQNARALIKDLVKYKTFAELQGRKPSSKVQKLVKLFLAMGGEKYRSFSGDLGSYFAKEGMYGASPDGGESKGSGQEAVEDLQRREQSWVDRCAEVGSRFPDDEKQWKEVCVKPLNDWFEHWRESFGGYLEELKAIDEPLAAKISVSVTQVTADAKGKDGKTYPVILIDRRVAVPAKSPRPTSTDVDASTTGNKRGRLGLN